MPPDQTQHVANRHFIQVQAFVIMWIGQIAAGVPRTGNSAWRGDQQSSPRAEHASHLRHAPLDVFAVQVFKNIQHQYGIEACIRERQFSCITDYSSPFHIAGIRLCAYQRGGVANYILPRGRKSIAGNSCAAADVEHRTVAGTG